MRFPLHAACLLAAVSIVEGFRGIHVNHLLQKAADNVGPLTNTSKNSTDVPFLGEKKFKWNKFDWAKVKGPEVFGTCVALAGFGVLVSAAGIGGGGLYLAALMLIHGLSAHDAIPLSHAVVLFGAMGSLFVNARRWHSKGSCDIDLDRCRLVVPASLLGTVVGFVLNTRVPEHSMMVLLAVVLTALIIITLRIWWQQRQEEAGLSVLPKQAQDAAAAVDAVNQAADSRLALPGVVAANKAEVLVPTSGSVPLLGSIDWWEVVLSLVLTVVVCLTSVFRFHAIACRDTRDQFVTHDWLPVSCKHPALYLVFGKNMDIWLQSDLFMLWLDFIPVKLCLSFMLYYGWRMREHKGWTLPQVVTVQSVALATGMLSGLIGIGGGLIFSPFFLTTMDPLMAVGTSSTCLLFIAASATLQYAFTDRIVMSLAVAYGCVTLVASIFGTHAINLVRNKLPSGKSFTTLVVAFVVILTNCLTVSKLVMSDPIPIYGLR